ncbi:15-hydroxyprostaglandin dehydrogenase [NAD(+)]-like [Onthophagus taurus]|uniref:15-hydroxyprostaglandin dehydrogenase [NAD(+)]-like n=1 Tax=Onthophagus taurus TaxID=166361 RepID=UPI0039BDC22A
MFVENKVVLVTGGAAGIGLCIVKELLKNNAKVCIADISIQFGPQVLNDLEKEYGSGRCIFCKVDVSDKNEFEAAMKKTVEEFGNFDILINNAGILDDSIWEREIEINLKGAINGCILAMEHYLPKYRSTQKAVIVNLASNLGIEKPGALPVYSATKSALIAFSKSISSDVNYNSQKVDVITLCPGPTETMLLANFTRKGLNERFNNLLVRFLNERVTTLPQKPECVAKNLMEILNDCKNGEFWEIEDGMRKEVIIRNQPEYK